MRYVKQSTASEDTVQLFLSGVPVDGLAFGAVLVEIRKEGSSGFTTKTITAGNWVDRSGTTPGNYAIIFSAADFDTLGLFRYRVMAAVPGTFDAIEDSVVVLATLPTTITDPPVISEQSDSPPGITPNPVFQGGVLTINGTDLAGATAVIIKASIGDPGTALTITGNTSSVITATVPVTTPLGIDQIVCVTTPGGTDEGLVSVEMDPASIPGSGLCDIWGQVLDPNTGQPMVGVGVVGRVLNMPNIIDGIMWTDDVIPVTTDTTGTFHITLPRDRRCEIMIRKGRYRREFIVPNVATANLFSEIPEY